MDLPIQVVMSPDATRKVLIFDAQDATWPYRLEFYVADEQLGWTELPYSPATREHVEDLQTALSNAHSFCGDISYEPN